MRVTQEAEWLNSLNYETRCKRGQKKRPRRLTRRPSEEIYLTTVPEREEMEQEAPGKGGENRGLAQLQNALSNLTYPLGEIHRANLGARCSQQEQKWGDALRRSCHSAERNLPLSLD